jgi:predicted esterase
MHEHHLTVSRTARYFTLGPTADAVREIWFVCHGYAHLAARFLERFRDLDDGRRLLVAPEGLSRCYLSEHPAERRVGASWMTREDRLAEIADYVGYLDAVYGAVLGEVERAAVRVTALGFSQGAATVSRWAALGRAAIDRLVLWGGELPPDLDLAAAGPRWRALRVTLVCGERDAYVPRPVVDTSAARLRAHGLAPEVRWFAGGHELDPRVLRELAEQG